MLYDTDTDNAEAVLHVDEALLVLVKPAGLLAVPGRGEDKQDCLSRRAQAQWPDALVVHRLDMSTSGLVVMARGIEAQRALSRAFEQRQVYKRYRAVVGGQLANPLPDNGWSTIDLPLAVDWMNRPRSKVCFDSGKPSLTRWRLAQPETDPQAPATHTGIGTRVELAPVTGRTHQLRVHLQALGHPILGDALYANPAQQALANRLLLHAELLELPHPVTGQMLRFHSPCPF
ncbi:MAG: RluA family pseudouridine synthase [Hydrogenophaga sp.]|uniref:RluA family pseudouridine synthase n=1 Tax=Hydrogenophaga sp. TaxID=1904254 RepID=UPI0027318A3E|nr:RluA family pseudouridine synthase [Hydrogenophaga sp.]MDP2163677.1 RluA family pseudouridine synthase [Hydrogenophaga sp.]MDP3475977.1 RluA family pseudouridine synthase [Hydrogenophaga sp.]